MICGVQAGSGDGCCRQKLADAGEGRFFERFCIAIGRGQMLWLYGLREWSPNWTFQWDEFLLETKLLKTNCSWFGIRKLNHGALSVWLAFETLGATPRTADFPNLVFTWYWDNVLESRNSPSPAVGANSRDLCSDYLSIVPQAVSWFWSWKS